MAEPAVLRQRVQAYVTQLRADRAKAAATYQTELARMDSQIAATEQVLAAWDGRVDSLISLLSSAGITIQV